MHVKTTARPRPGAALLTLLAALVAFHGTLTDATFLGDPRFADPFPWP